MTYFDTLETELRDAANRQANRRRRAGRALVGAGVFAAAVTAVMAVALLHSSPADASSVEVIRTPDHTIVRVVRPDDPPAEVLHDLRSSGLDAHAVAVPTGPSKVGDVLGLAGDGPGAAADDPLSVRLPSDWRGSLSVLVGAAAHDAEPYAVATDAFAPGEPLHCDAGPGSTVAELRAAAAPAELDVRWISATDGTAIEMPRADRMVTAALAVSPHKVVATVDLAKHGRGQSCE